MSRVVLLLALHASTIHTSHPTNPNHHHHGSEGERKAELNCSSHDPEFKCLIADVFVNTALYLKLTFIKKTYHLFSKSKHSFQHYFSWSKRIFVFIITCTLQTLIFYWPIECKNFKDLVNLVKNDPKSIFGSNVCS